MAGAFRLQAALQTFVPKTGKVSAATRLAVQPNITAKVQGKLDGGPQISLAWAANSSVACFPATQNEHFDGAHKVYAIDLPARSELTLTATSNNAKLDISMYAYMVAANDTTTLPPNISSVVTCEESHNSGKPEKLTLGSTSNPYRVYVGIAGAKGTMAGVFTLQATLERN